MNLIEKFKGHAESVFLNLKAEMPVKEVEAILRTKKMIRDGCSQSDFLKIYYAYLTAQVSQRWNYCCHDHHIDDKETQNAFFKVVIDKYAEEKDLDSATYFSEAMYAANADSSQATLITILTAFLKKISEKDASITPEGISEVFQFIAGVWDGYSHHFENGFDDFLAELRLQGVLANKERGKNG